MWTCQQGEYFGSLALLLQSIPERKLTINEENQRFTCKACTPNSCLIFATNLGQIWLASRKKLSLLVNLSDSWLGPNKCSKAKFKQMSSLCKSLIKTVSFGQTYIWKPHQIGLWVLFLKIVKLRQSCESFCLQKLQMTAFSALLQLTTFVWTTSINNFSMIYWNYNFVCTIEIDNFWIHYWKLRLLSSLLCIAKCMQYCILQLFQVNYCQNCLSILTLLQ